MLIINTLRANLSHLRFRNLKTKFLPVLFSTRTATGLNVLLRNVLKHPYTKQYARNGIKNMILHYNSIKYRF